jgi:membrane associated rhomboid family serine protease
MAIEQFRPRRFNAIPEVTKNLLIINGLFFLATLLLQNQGIELTDILGLHYFESEKFRWYQFITYMFMHGGWLHIGLNMFALWMFGGPVENMWGPKKFLTYYIFTGLGAAFAHFAVVYFELRPAMDAINGYLSNPHHTVNELQSLLNSNSLSNFYSEELRQSKDLFVEKFNQMLATNQQEAFDYSMKYMQEFKGVIANAPVVVGASGAIFGILLAFGMLFPDTTLFMMPIPFPIKAKYAVILYGLFELFKGVEKSQGDNVAHFAHLGGLLFGFILIMYWRWQNQKRRNDFFNP